ncbi:MAG TPA: ABC transporter permease [Candidatus Acidoferrales bacterium]|nr:ABC transporter permease [Candidatus Acidoferrales bacterium]
MHTFWQDLRYGLRMLVKSPGFTAVAVLSLTLGIGANTTIFTLAKAIFLQSVPVKDPASLVVIYSTQQSRNGPLQQFMPSSYLNARDYREKNDVFSGLSIIIFTGANLSISGKQVAAPAELVNGNFFDVIGVPPAIGRGFLPEEDQASGGRPVAVLSYALWSRQFGADPGILGRTIVVSGQDYTVVGVAPRQFHDAAALGNPDLWIPIAMHQQMLTGIQADWFNQRGARMVGMVARLKPGVTPAQAQASIQALGAHLAEQYPTDNSGRSVTLLPITQTTVPPAARAIFVRAGALMMLIVGFVLLIACANVANLLLARATRRQREIAIRISLGASRKRLVRQLLTESLLLGLTAGALGIVCAYWGRALLLRLLPPGLVARLDFSLDTRVFLFTLVLSLAATALFGLMPAVRATASQRIASLKDRTDLPTGSQRWYGLRGALVMAQVALSLIALVAAGLFVHSLRNARQIDPGFEVNHELLMFLNPGAEHYDQARAEQLYRQLVERLNGLPMVAGASLADAAPFAGGLARTTFPGSVDTSDPRNGKLTPVIAVEPAFFATSGITLIRGRGFTDQDDAQSAMVAVVNRALVDQMWPGQDALGKHLHFLLTNWDVRVVGIVNTVKYATLGEPPQPIVYFPLKQHYSPMVTVYVRTKGDPGAAIPTVRSAVQAVAPDLPLRNVQTGPQLLDQSLTAPRLGAELLGAFGLLALLLASIGTYGVVSYSVSQRTQEIGIRMALGAQPTGILRLILESGMAMVVVGVAAGLGLSTLLAHSMNSLLYGIGAFDPPSFLGTAALLIAVALAACWIPARRAASVDPVIALRHE